MKYRILIVLSFLISTVASTTVDVSVDKDFFPVDADVKVTLIIDPSKPVGGQLMIYKIEGNKFAMARLLYNKPTPEQCLTCSRDTPLSDFLNRTFIFDPPGEGNYVVEANFAGIQKSVNFTVGSTSTTTSIWKHTTSSTILDIPSSTSSLTTTSSTTTSVEKTLTTTIQQTIKLEEDGFTWSLVYPIVFMSIVILFTLIFLRKYLGTPKPF
ncbi:MAG: hypothetical protein ABH851_00815 [Methanobacteriota archaeon]